MNKSIEGVHTDGIAIHTKHVVHYWILHKMGYRFCKCGSIKLPSGNVIKPKLDSHVQLFFTNEKRL